MSNQLRVIDSPAGDPLDSNALKARIDQIAHDASHGCGLSYELYVQRFSSMIDDHFGNADPTLRTAALTLARDSGYLSSTETEALLDELAEAGYCSHGLDAQTCPRGCFEF